MVTPKRLHVILIKPSKYDDDGFVVRYLRGVLPSNTLAAMRSLTLDFTERWRSGLGIEITVDLLDDIVDDIPYDRIARMNRGGTKVVAALVGVQSNQYVRAADIARHLTGRGVKSVLGGFHVSGILALFDKPAPEIQELLDAGVTIVEGEAENIWENVLADIVAGNERPLYRKINLPDITDAPVPRMDSRYLKKFALRDMATIDCSRGCPFNCSFCTIINVQGKKMRCRSAENVLAVIRSNHDEGIRQYFFTDDNFSRNPAWEGVFDGLITLREIDGYDNITFMMQVDTRCHKIPGFVEKAGRAGCTQVFIGMESINPKNLEAVGKKQNDVTDYANFIEAWHRAGVATHVGYIIGFPFDTPGSVRRDIDRLKNEIKVDQASFFILTPLPGSRDHFDMVTNGDRMDDDLNRFDSFHTVMDHPLMSTDEWRGAYDGAWESFYDFDNLRNVLNRVSKREYWGIFKNIMWYKNSLLEPSHPMVAGFVRKKPRTDVRSGLVPMKRRSWLLMRTREYARGFWKRIGLFFELQELWWMTRKPDDPKFKLIADFSTTLADARFRLSSLELTESYTKWCDEAAAIVQSLHIRLCEFSDTSVLRGTAKKRFNQLVADTRGFFERVRVPELAAGGIGTLTTFISQKIRQAEEASLANVAQRRRITRFWLVTLERLKHGRMIRFALSIPRIAVSAFRDLRMSIWFAYHLKRHSF